MHEISTNISIRWVVKGAMRATTKVSSRTLSVGGDTEHLVMQCKDHHPSECANTTTLGTLLAESQGSTGADASRLGLSDPAGELEALLRNYQPSSGNQGDLVSPENEPLRLQGFSQHEDLQAQLLAQNNQALQPSLPVPAASLAPGAWSSRFGRVQIQDVQFCRAADGSLVLLGQGASGSVSVAVLGARQAVLGCYASRGSAAGTWQGWV